MNSTQTERAQLFGKQVKTKDGARLQILYAPQCAASKQVVLLFTRLRRPGTKS